MLIKFFLKQKNFNETYTGGIGSYLLFNMIYAYALFLKEIKNKNPKNDLEFTNHGSFLLGFLKFYAQELNWENRGISISNGFKFYNNSSSYDSYDSYDSDNYYDNYRSYNRGYYKQTKFLFYDFQSGSDIGQKAYNFSYIVRLFESLIDKIKLEENPEDHSYLSKMIDITADLKNRKKYN